jgi:hypothetical protein
LIDHIAKMRSLGDGYKMGQGGRATIGLLAVRLLLVAPVDHYTAVALRVAEVFGGFRSAQVMLGLFSLPGATLLNFPWISTGASRLLSGLLAASRHRPLPIV